MTHGASTNAFTGGSTVSVTGNRSQRSDVTTNEGRGGAGKRGCTGSTWWTTTALPPLDFTSQQSEQADLTAETKVMKCGNVKMETVLTPKWNGTKHYQQTTNTSLPLKI